jgi:hypothetical protein
MSRRYWKANQFPPTDLAAGRGPLPNLPAGTAQFALPVVIAPVGLSKLSGGGPEWEQETDDSGCAIDPIDHEGAPCKFAGGNADKLAVQPLC